MSKIFITGGAGFIGAHMVKRFSQENDVIVYDNHGKDTLSRLGWSHLPNVEVVTGDILDAAQLTDAMKGADYVIHAAAVVGVDEVINDQLNTMKTNIFGTYNVLEAARENNIDQRVVMFSTSEIFGKMAYRVKETDDVVSGSPGEPRWGYGISKVAGEHFINAYHKRFNLPVTCVRPFNVYGPGQTMEGAMKVFILKALNNEDITINGDGSPIRAWCYVDDFVDGIACVMRDPKAIGESFNLGNSKTAITVLGLAQKIIDLLGSSSKVIHGDPLPMEIHLRIPDCEKIKDMLGFEAMTSMDEGILKTVESIKAEVAQPATV